MLCNKLLVSTRKVTLITLILKNTRCNSNWRVGGLNPTLRQDYRNIVIGLGNTNTLSSAGSGSSAGLAGAKVSDYDN